MNRVCPDLCWVRSARCVSTPITYDHYPPEFDFNKKDRMKAREPLTSKYIDLASLSKEYADDISRQVAEELLSQRDTIIKSIREKILADAGETIGKRISKQTESALRNAVIGDFRRAKPLEDIIERGVYSSRWLMFPAYLAVGLTLIMVAFYIMGDTYKLFKGVMAIFALAFPGLGLGERFPTDASFTLSVQVLKILDYLMLTSLIVMVLIGGFENTISRIQKGVSSGPSWVGNLDLHRLKTKIAAAIVLISSIHLLQRFMEIGTKPIPTFDWNIFWTVIIHLVFILSALGLAYIDVTIKAAGHGDDDA